MYNPQLERTIYGGLTLAEYIQAWGPEDAVDVIAWRLNCETFVYRYCGYPDCQRHLMVLDPHPLAGRGLGVRAVTHGHGSHRHGSHGYTGHGRRAHG